MTKKNETASLNTPKKRRWYQNFVDAYNVVKRTYPWISVALIGLPVLLMAVGILLGIVLDGIVFWILSGVMLSLLGDLSLIAFMLRPAMYKQVDGKVGSVYTVLSQIKRGWVIDDEPIAVNRNQDLVWQLVGRPGVVLISEGPSSRVTSLLHNERKRIKRAVANVPIIYVQVGNDKGQVKLSKLMSKLRKQKATLTKNEVPAVANRLNAIGSKAIPVPKGIDPHNTRPGAGRRAMRG